MPGRLARILATGFNAVDARSLIGENFVVIVRIIQTRLAYPVKDDVAEPSENSALPRNSLDHFVRYFSADSRFLRAIHCPFGVGPQGDRTTERLLIAPVAS